MDKTIDIPDNAIKYILYQRTAYLVFQKTYLYKKTKKFHPYYLYKLTVDIESRIRKKTIKQLFMNDMLKEYESIKSFIPKRCNRILDVGCGVAGIDVLLFRHYDSVTDLEFYLLDKTVISNKVFYNYHKQSAFYNSLDIARKTLNINGTAQQNIHTLEVSSDYQIEISKPVDLVISLISWGFHYPVSTYIAQVYQLLRKSGHLILDIRRGLGGEKELRPYFQEYHIIQKTPKYNRILACKY